MRAGRVTVNGEPAQVGQPIVPEDDVVCVDGAPVSAEALAYWAVHKPQDVITTVRDPQGRRTVLDLLPDAARAVRLFPVGRLDRDTEGLVLLTNDGALAQVLLHPSHESEREYEVHVRGEIPERALSQLAEGIVLDDGPTAPAHVTAATYDAAADVSTFRLTVIEGRKRQIRRALEQLGHPVVRLVRHRMGPLVLGDLPSGAARPVEGDALAALRALAGS